MKVMVTGGSGFVGSNVLEVLARRDAEVLAPRHAELELTDATLARLREQFESAGVR